MGKKQNVPRRNRQAGLQMPKRIDQSVIGQDAGLIPVLNTKFLHDPCRIVIKTGEEFHHHQGPVALYGFARALDRKSVV